MKLKCGTCGKDIDRPMKVINERVRRGYTRSFCSFSCSGLAAGRQPCDVVRELKAWFEANPDEELTMEQICLKWDLDNAKAWKKLRYAKNKGWFTVRYELLKSKRNVVAMTVWSKA